MHNIVLIGFMGCGKSTLGRSYAAHHRMQQIDTDQYIEEWQQMSINEIFQTKGESYFRELETQAMRKLIEAYPKGVVLSVGGGLPMTPANQPLLKEFGTVIYLQTSVECLCDRLSHDDTRPLLKGGNLKDKITNLMQLRESTYRALAEYTIQTDEKPILALEQEIMLAMDGVR